MSETHSEEPHTKGPASMPSGLAAAPKAPDSKAPEEHAAPETKVEPKPPEKPAELAPEIAAATSATRGKFGTLLSKIMKFPMSLWNKLFKKKES